MLTTTNYKFKKPELTDSPPDITVMNGNWDIIDTNLKKLNDDKAPKDVATTSKDGLMSTTDKNKLDGIESRANNYTHPSKHPASIITEDATHRFLSDAERKLIQAWETFKASGGIINGDVLLPRGTKLCGTLSGNKDPLIYQSSQADDNGRVIVGSSGQITQIASKLRPEVYWNNQTHHIALLSDYVSNKNPIGYTKLPNGFILQWGDFTTAGINVNSEINPQRVFPLAFPSATLIVVPFVKKCVSDQGATLNAEVVIKSVTINSKFAFQTRIKAKEYVSGGVVVGYLAIGY